MNFSANFQLMKKRIKYGVREAWPFWLILLIFVTCYSSISLFGFAEPTIRLTGMAFQMIGFIMTVWQIIVTRKALNLPTWWAGIRNYFSGFPSATNVISASGTATASLTASATVEIIRNPKLELKDRVERLEHEIDSLRREVGRIDSENARKIAGLESQLREKANELQTQVNEVRSRFESLIGGGTTANVVGIVYFVVGLILASASVELSKLT